MDLAEPVARVEGAQALMRTCLWDHGVDIDLHLHLGHGQPFDDESGSHGRDAFEIATDHIVDRLTIGPVGDVGGHFAHVLQARSCFLEQHLHVLHGLLGLGRSILGAPAAD